MEKKKAEYSTEQLKELVIQKISEFNTLAQIFVDGLTCGNQRDGGAGLCAITAEGQELHRESQPAGKFCSSFSAECCAFLLALKWIQQDTHPAQTIMVLTDSMSMTTAIQANDPKDRDPWMQDIKTAACNTLNKITLLWIPSHCGIDGNEIADELAAKGTSLDQSNTIVTHSIVKAKIRNKRWT